MTWKTFKIVEKVDARAFNEVYFHLYGSVPYKDSEMIAGITCVHSFPFNTWQAGDFLEIDTYKTRDYKWSHQFNDINIVRKYGSSAVTPYSSSGLSIPTTPSSSAEVARTVTQTVLDHADRTGGIPQIEIGTDKTSIRYYPPKK